MLATLMVATSRTASAQQTGSCKATKQWQLEQVEKDHIKLTGQVEIDCGNESMSADQVEIFQDTNVMIATGNVVFTSGGSRIAADRLEYNTRTRTGTFFNGFGTSTMHEGKGPRRPRSLHSTASGSSPATSRCLVRRKPTSTSTARRSRR